MSDHVLLGGTAVAGAVAGACLAQCLLQRPAHAAPKAAAKTPAPVPQPAPQVDAAAVNFRHDKKGTKTLNFDGASEAACFEQVRRAFDVAEEKYMIIQRTGETVVSLTAVQPGETLTVYDDDRTWKAVSDQLRKDGNAKFKAATQSNKRSDYVKALKLWREASYVVPPTPSAEALSTKCLALNNCAQVSLKLNNNDACRAICSEILAMEGSNHKALYRRGLATHKLGPRDIAQLEEAQEDLKRAMEVSADAHVAAALAEVAKDLKKARDAKSVKLSTSELD